MKDVIELDSSLRWIHWRLKQVQVGQGAGPCAAELCFRKRFRRRTRDQILPLASLDPWFSLELAPREIPRVKAPLHRVPVRPTEHRNSQIQSNLI